MIFDLFGKERLRLKRENEVLTQALIDSNHWGEEANKRLAIWVKKHDELLIEHKALKAKYGEK